MVREQTLKHRGCRSPPHASLQEDEASGVSFAPAPVPRAAPGAAAGRVGSGGMGWGLKYSGGWGLGAVGTAAHGWLLLVALLAGGRELSAPLMLLHGWGLGSEPALALPTQPGLPALGDVPAPGDLPGSFPPPSMF